MRQVWRYALFGLGVIGIIWGIVMLFSQVWHALIAFALALLCFAATRLVGREEMVTEVTTANITSVTGEEEQRSAVVRVTQEKEPSVSDLTNEDQDSSTLDASTADRAKNLFEHDVHGVRNADATLAENSSDDEAPSESEEDEW